MKRYLMRGGQSPLEALSPDQIIAKNLLGDNAGNLFYAYGVYRTLLTEDTVIDMDCYGVERSYNDEDIARINEEYDGYICPLADAFRDAFRGKLRRYTRFFNKLKIPVYVIGMGMRIPYDPDFSQKFIYEEEAKAFIKAVLKKSTMMGLRGSLTGEYFTKLGFKEGRDFQVIGCPSMYSLGRELPQRALRLSPDGTVPSDIHLGLNMSSMTPEPIIQLEYNLMERFSNYTVVEQSEAELRMLYLGMDYLTNQKDENTLLPLNIHHPIIQDRKYRIFVNVKTWMNFAKTIDLGFGSKLHGNVANVLGGAPVVFLALDGRMRELCEVHNFPNIPAASITGKESLEDILAKVDLQSHIKSNPKNFDAFVSFLDKNGLDHIYAGGDLNRKTAPLDRQMAKIKYPQVKSVLDCSTEEVIRRENLYIRGLRSQNYRLRNENSRLREINSQTVTGIMYKCLKSFPAMVNRIFDKRENKEEQ